MMKARSRACSARNARPFSAWDTVERAIDDLHEVPLLTKDKAFRLGHREVVAALGVRAELRAIGLVRGEALEGDEPPRDVVRSFVRQKVSDEVAAAARDDASPVLGVRPERVPLERIDFVANHA